MQIEIGLPDEQGRHQIFSIHTEKMREHNLLHDDVNLLQLAHESPQYSGAEIAGLVRFVMSSIVTSLLNLDRTKRRSQPGVGAGRISRHHRCAGDHGGLSPRTQGHQTSIWAGRHVPAKQTLAVRCVLAFQMIGSILTYVPVFLLQWELFMQGFLSAAHHTSSWLTVCRSCYCKSQSIKQRRPSPCCSKDREVQHVTCTTCAYNL